MTHTHIIDIVFPSYGNAVPEIVKRDATHK